MSYSYARIVEIRREWNDPALTVEEIAAAHGTTRTALCKLRARHGWPARAKTACPVHTHRGVFASVRAAARAYGMSPNSAHYRASRQINGWRFADE